MGGRREGVEVRGGGREYGWSEGGSGGKGRREGVEIRGGVW